MKAHHKAFPLDQYYPARTTVCETSPAVLNYRCNVVLLRGIGLEVSAAEFCLSGRIALKLLCALRPASRDRLVFGSLHRQAALQLLLGGPRMLDVRYTRGPLAGLRFNCQTAEKYFLMGADFEHALLPAIRKSLAKASVVYDIGANAGYWSLAFARLSPAGEVYAFEPSPINYARLIINTARVANIHPIRAAVSDANGSAAFSESGTTSRIRRDGDIRVPQVRLDDLNLPPPNLLKIDIEGFAGAALAGAISLLRRSRPAILCEVHDPGEEETTLRILDDLGYRFTIIERLRDFPFHVFAR